MLTPDCGTTILLLSRPTRRGLTARLIAPDGTETQLPLNAGQRRALEDILRGDCDAAPRAAVLPFRAARTPGAP